MGATSTSATAVAAVMVGATTAVGAIMVRATAVGAVGAGILLKRQSEYRDDVVENMI
jgi:hypothetical protein